MTNISNTVLYIGVTNDISRRVYEHKTKAIKGFTQRYNLTKLVYIEETNTAIDAITREKQLKKWNRKKKNKLIESMNPDWSEINPFL